jgi:hypothetical protein
MADIPGGVTGLLCKDYKGKDADQLVTKIDTGVMALSAEFRALERQAEELAQWEVVIESRKVVDATPAAVILGIVLNLKRRALELQQSQVVQVG